QVAHYLLAQGVKPGDLIGLYLERSVEMMIGLLGILKAGAAYVPLDAGYPLTRIETIVEEANITLMLIQSSLALPLRASATRVVALDCSDFKQQMVTQTDSNIDRSSIGLNASHLAYVIYTSGST